MEPELTCEHLPPLHLRHERVRRPVLETPSQVDQFKRQCARRCGFGTQDGTALGPTEAPFVGALRIVTHKGWILLILD